MFERQGIPVLSTDDMAKELSQSSSSLRKRIRHLLGDEAYLPDGSFNRPYVASKIFSRKSLQTAMNAIVHPAVRKEMNRRVAALAAKGNRVVLVEAALIYESGFDDDMDAVLVVDAEEKLRIRRVMKRDGVSETEVRLRMRSQWPVSRKLARADYVLRNNGGLSDLKEKVRFLTTVFKQLAKKGQQ